MMSAYKQGLTRVALPSAGSVLEILIPSLTYLFAHPRDLHCRPEPGCGQSPRPPGCTMTPGDITELLPLPVTVPGQDRKM